MTDFPITAESRALIANVSRRPATDIVRSALFVGILLLVWISLHPFEDLSGMYVGDVTSGKEACLYGLFGVLMAVMLRSRAHV